MSTLLTDTSEITRRETFISDGPSAAQADDTLSERIRSSDGVTPVFIVGPPRSGTTLLARILAHGDDVLSLSEPFFAWRILRPWLSRAFFRYLKLRLHWRAAVPSSRCPAELFSFMRECALRNGQRVLVIKEVFHDFGMPAPWCNVDLLDAIVDSGAAVIAIMRDPFDSVSSAVDLVHRYVCGWSGFALGLACCSVPRFIDREDIVRHASRNWSRYADWVRRRGPFVIRYEDLTSDPAAEINRVCTHADLRFDGRMLTERRRPTAFAGLGDPGVMLHAPKPVHAQSIGRGCTLPDRQRAIIRECCGRAAAEFGYPVQT